MRPRRRFTWSKLRRGSNPKMVSVPAFGLTRQASVLRSVVLPAPLGPNTVRNSPRSSCRSTPSTARIGPYRRVSPLAATGGEQRAVVDSAPGMPVHLAVDLDGLLREPLARLIEIFLGELADLVLHLQVLDARQRLLPLPQQLLLAAAGS